MKFLYSSRLEINEYGDVKIIIKDHEQEFEFISCLKDVVLPTFLSNLTYIIKGKINNFSVDGYDAMTKYKFIRNGNHLNITYKYRHLQKEYKFDLEMFMKAIHKAFKGYFRQQRIEGIIGE